MQRGGEGRPSDECGGKACQRNRGSARKHGSSEETLAVGKWTRMEDVSFICGHCMHIHGEWLKFLEVNVFSLLFRVGVCRRCWL